jgi:type II secretory pathway component PulF
MNQITSKSKVEDALDSLGLISDIQPSEGWNKRVVQAISQSSLNPKQSSKASSTLLTLLIAANTIIGSLALVQNHNHSKSMQRHIELEKVGTELRLTEINL